MTEQVVSVGELRASGFVVDLVDEDLVGFYAGVSRRLGLWEPGVAVVGPGDVLDELDRRLGPPESVAEPQVHGRPEQLPTYGDERTAMATNSLRRAAPPWSSLDRPMKRRLAISAVPLRRALERAGWTAPVSPYPVHDGQPPAGSEGA